MENDCTGERLAGKSLCAERNQMNRVPVSRVSDLIYKSKKFNHLIVSLKHHQKMLRKQSSMSYKKLISFWYAVQAKLKLCTKILTTAQMTAKGKRDDNE